MINDFLSWDLNHLTLQQVEQLHALKTLATVRYGRLSVQRMKSNEIGEWLRICE